MPSAWLPRVVMVSLRARMRFLTRSMEPTASRTPLAPVWALVLARSAPCAASPVLRAMSKMASLI